MVKMFKTRKTLEIEYNPTTQQLAQLEDIAKLIQTLKEILDQEEEDVVYFYDDEYSIDFIKDVSCLLNDMLEQRYSPNILEQ